MKKKYENLPIQIYTQFHLQKLEKKSDKTLMFFIFLLKNKDCGYSLESPMFLEQKQKKLMYTPVNPSFTK